MGHEDQFPPTSLSARCGFGQGTFGWTHGNGRGAPIPVVRETTIEPQGSTLQRLRARAGLAGTGSKAAEANEPNRKLLCAFALCMIPAARLLADRRGLDLDIALRAAVITTTTR